MSFFRLRMYVRNMFLLYRGYFDFFFFFAFPGVFGSFILVLECIFGHF